MGEEHNAGSSFWIKCIGYTQTREAFFTIGKEYEVEYGGYVTNDQGYTYEDPEMKLGSNPEDWFLSGWYRFEIVNDVVIPEHLGLSFEEVMGCAQ